MLSRRKHKKNGKSKAQSTKDDQELQVPSSGSAPPQTTVRQFAETQPPSPTVSNSELFVTNQEKRNYENIFDMTLDAAGNAQLGFFPRRPPPGIPDVITMTKEKQNHVSMNYGHVQYDFRKGVQKGETASGYGDDFCQVHGITRVFVVDVDNHLIAMCTPHRYMMYMANRMYANEGAKFQGNIFQFGGGVVAAPRWAIRAPAWNILVGQSGSITRTGDEISISGSRMVDGIAQMPEVLIPSIPYSGVSWVVMDRWMEDARMHKISIVAADTGLTQFEGKYDKTATLPLVIREDEADMFMCEPVRGLVLEDQRFQPLVRKGLVTYKTKALQFRAGWYAPHDPSGVTRVMRSLQLDEDESKPKAEDGTGPWKPVKAFSDEYIRPPSKDLWVIGGIDNVNDEVEAKELGTHFDMEVHLEPGSKGGFN